MRDIENLIGKKIPAIDEHEFPLQDNNPAQPAKQQQQKSQKNRGNGSRKKNKNSRKRVRRQR